MLLKAAVGCLAEGSQDAPPIAKNHRVHKEKTGNHFLKQETFSGWVRFWKGQILQIFVKLENAPRLGHGWRDHLTFLSIDIDQA